MVFDKCMITCIHRYPIRQRISLSVNDRGWDGWLASPTQWTWVWVNSRSWWRACCSMRSQRVGHNWVTEQLNWNPLCSIYSSLLPLYPLATTNLFTVSIVLPFPEYHTPGITPYIAFLDWLLSLSNMPLRPLHVFLWLNSSFFFKLCENVYFFIFIVWLFHSLSICSISFKPSLKSSLRISLSVSSRSLMLSPAFFSRSF